MELTNYLLRGLYAQLREYVTYNYPAAMLLDLTDCVCIRYKGERDRIMVTVADTHDALTLRIIQDLSRDIDERNGRDYRYQSGNAKFINRTAVTAIMDIKARELLDSER